MIICLIGDSLTEGDYGVPGKSGIANVHKENYPYFLARATGAEVRNFGKCGWRSSDMLKWFKEGGLDLKGANKIVIMLGANGGQARKGDTPDNLAYKELVEGVRKAAPEAEVYLATSPNATVNPAYSNCGYMPQVTEAACFVRKYAEETGLPLIDLFRNPKFSPASEWRYQPNDGLHFTEEGYRVLAGEIQKAIGL